MTEKQISDLENRIKALIVNEEDIERQKNIFLKGFAESSEVESINWIKEEFKKLNCPEAESFCKGEFKKIFWAKVDSQQSRDKATKKCAKPAFKFKNCKIWAEKDLKFKFR